MRLTLVITTYERPDALAAVLASVGAQRDPPDELVIADDGSAASTRELVEAFATRARQPVLHAWQEHAGFRLTRLRNLAIARSSGDYVVFIDGDMVLHPCFVADHRRLACRGRYTQGVRLRTDAALTKALLADPLAPPGIAARGLGGARRLYGLHAPRLQGPLRHLASTLIAIKGCNQGFWRDDLVRVNGFDEQIEGWGPEDKELCARLRHAGVGRQTLLFGGIAWHLEHPPAKRDRRGENEAILAATLASRRVRCARGLDAHL
jgi:glycosyltransferase involved in cell wall biosynthesis